MKEGVAVEKVKQFFSSPIPDMESWNWEAARQIPVEDNGEELVPVSMIPERILVRSEYFIQGLPGSMPECFLRKGVLLKLLETAEMLPPGYKFVIFDGWRPCLLQESLFKILKSEIEQKYPGLSPEELNQRVCQYVALPSVSESCPSPHLTGGAVDLTIVDDRGFLLDMGSGFDDTSERSETCYFEKIARAEEELSGAETEILYNRRFLFNIMTSSGFSNYHDEWWHYDYGNQNWAWESGKGSKAIYGKISPRMRWKTFHN